MFDAGLLQFPHDAADGNIDAANRKNTNSHIIQTPSA